MRQRLGHPAPAIHRALIGEAQKRYSGADMHEELVSVHSPEREYLVKENLSLSFPALMQKTGRNRRDL